MWIWTLKYKLKQAKNLAKNKHETKYILHWESLMGNTHVVNCMQQLHLRVRFFHLNAYSKASNKNNDDSSKSLRM